MNIEQNLKEKIEILKNKQIYYKLKRYEKKELKTLHKKLKLIEEEKLNKLKQLKEEDKKRNENLKKQILVNQFESRNRIKKETKNTKLREVIEDMCILSDITKKEIIEEKKNHPEKFIKTEEALQSHNKNSSLFVMGLLAKSLENNGITTAIERNNNQNNLEEANTTLQFMINGLGKKKKYD